MCHTTHNARPQAPGLKNNFSHIRQMVESDPSTPIVTIISSIQTSMGYNNLQKGMVGETTSN